MRTMTVTEASRDFSGLLALIQSGETVRIIRGNEPIAEVAPARRRTGADLEAAPLGPIFRRSTTTSSARSRKLSSW